MRSTIMNALSDLVKAGEPVHLLTGDLGFGLMKDYMADHPAHFTNVGVSEANMIGVAAGMAATGIRPFCYSMVPFVFMRAFEQVRMDLCVDEMPVTLIGVGGGLVYGNEGPSHFAIEDLSMARALPNLTTICPGDPWEAKAAVKMAMENQGPTFIRIGRNNDPEIHSAIPKNLRKATRIVEAGEDLLLIATGHILHNTVEAAGQLIDEGIALSLLSVPVMKPFDRNTVAEMARRAKVVITVEEHSHIGGLGSEVAEILFEEKYRGEFMKIALPDEYPTEVGNHDHLREVYKLTPEDLAARIAERYESL